jgi:hypothetical protein
VSEVICQDRDAMADVRFYIEQVARSASPLAGVKRHHLHEAAGTDEARCARVEQRIFRKQDA